MSKENNEPQPTEEIDLGQVFGYIEKGFKKIGNLIVKLLEAILWVIKKLTILAFMFLNVFRKRFITILLIGIIGYAIPYVLDKFSKKQFGSNALIKQNYETGKILYDNIAKYNTLAKLKDSVNLGQELNIPDTLAAKITGFYVSDVINKNTLIGLYNDHIKEIDSTLITSFDVFLEDFDLENTSLQQIAVTATSTNVFEYLAEPLIQGIESNKFFIKERENQKTIINSKIKTLEDLIMKSDTLQNNYFKLLNKYYSIDESQTSQTSNINFSMSNNKDKISTKEFELFQGQIKNRDKLNKERELLLEKTEIVELQKDFTNPTLIGSRYESKIKLISLFFMVLASFYFILKELGLGSIIKNYGSKEKLLE